MINQVSLRHFKCFETISLPFAPLTVLSGKNASGKSSVLQALVLLQQTMREQEWSNRLMLNGKTIHLGSVSDVVDELHGRDGFEIGIANEGAYCQWAFSGERTDLSVSIKNIFVNQKQVLNLEHLHFLLPKEIDPKAQQLVGYIKKLTYLSAERIGPREIYVLEDAQTATVVSSTGENAISVLYLGGEEQVLSELVHSEVPNTRLRQVEAWMQIFFPNCEIELQRIPQTNSIKLGIRTAKNTGFHRPVNVGFGLTQVLPIIIAALSAKKSDILIIENPEVHLHPAGQARMGQFLGQVAQAGVQVILETHSDHILNGIRRAVKEKNLQAENAMIHFFNARSEQEQVISLYFDQNGNIDTWPEGFFDQFDKDSSYFAGWGE